MAKATVRPVCFGLEWDPTDPMVCPRCIEEPECRVVFAHQRISEGLVQIGESATPEQLAQWASTSVEAINQAMQLRQATPAPESAEPKAKKPRATRKPRAKKSEQPELPSVSTPEEPAISIPPLEPVQEEVHVLKQVVLNLSTGETTEVEWPGFLPVMALPTHHVVQVTYWDHNLSKWCWLVQEPSGRELPEGVVEKTMPSLLGV